MQIYDFLIKKITKIQFVKNVIIEKLAHYYETNQ